MTLLSRLLPLLLAAFLTASLSYGQIPYYPDQFWQSGESGMYSTGMVWHDANNDGYIDVFFSNGNDMTLAENTIYLSDHGTLPLTASWSSDNHEYSGHCAVGDIDDNGYPDFAVANYLGSGGFSTANRSTLYMNFDGLPSTSPDWYTGDSIYSFSCALGDADGDGDLDLAFATGDGYHDVNTPDRIYYNVDGVLQTLPGWETAYGTQALDVAWADIDNDGDLDLAFCYDNLPPALFDNDNGQIGTTPVWQAVDNESANTIIFGDINGDGWLDLVVAFNYQLGGSGYFRVYYNDGAGNLNTNSGWQSGDGGYGSALALYDYDNDGDPDLAAGRWWDRARIYPNTGGTFSANPQWQATPNTVVEEMAFVDIDGHGVESRADTIYNVGGKKVFYASHSPLQAVDSVVVDGINLSNDVFCYDLFSGWFALGQVPVDSIAIYYQYSFTCDLTISNWDTYNMAFANTNPAPVSFSAEPMAGFVPLDVQFTDHSVDPTQWRWDFGDGGTSTDENPAHTYITGGAFNVFHEALLTDGWHNRIERDMIIVLADTVTFPSIEAAAGDTVIAPILLTNAHPLERFIITVEFAGPSNLEYIGFDTDSCRTDYFNGIDVIGGSPETYRLAFEFLPGIDVGQPPLAPGSGRIINLHFVAIGPGGAATLDTVTIGTDSTLLDAGYIAYQPRIVPGSISLGFLCGDANGDATVNVGDAVYLIEYIFKSGPPPQPMNVGDVNLDGTINIGDPVYLINFIFKSGPSPCNP